MATISTLPATFDEAFAAVQERIDNFEKHAASYLRPAYQESEARDDFISPFWMALGWDVLHRDQHNPDEQEVKVEKNVKMAEGRKRADYAFYLAPDYRQARFFVEAKKPSVDIRNRDNCFQALRYGWNGGTSIAVLTDFEQLLILDCRAKPDIDSAMERVVRSFHYLELRDRDTFAELYFLFGREAVASGSLEKFVAEKLPKASSKRARQRGLFASGFQSIDEAFLSDLDSYRGELARSFAASNPDLDSESLTETTQRVLDRLVFMRFLEDKLIEPEPILSQLAGKASHWSGFKAASRRLDGIYNGLIFKPHFVDSAAFRVDESDGVFAEVCESLASDQSPYLFNTIPIHILGSIYERFLGNVIVVGMEGARVEAKPEVRKAGGVYYTPDYIVRYIVDQTVGRLIENKSPQEIAAMRFADIACGSGSFLLGVYDLLLRYHARWYNAPKNKRAAKRDRCIENADGSWSLSLWQKRAILLNNIYGVDLDAQAVEVAQMSLYLKLLEDATTATARDLFSQSGAILPTLTANIVCGNSLIDWDIFAEGEQERRLNPMSWRDAFPAVMKQGGFDAIVGNPPYIRIQTMQEFSPASVVYYKDHYKSAGKGNYDIYVVFIEQAMRRLKAGGKLGYIVPHKFMNAQYGAGAREVLSSGQHLSGVVHFGDAQVFDGATTYTCLLFADHASCEEVLWTRVDDLQAWRIGDKNAATLGRVSADTFSAREWNISIGSGSALFDKLAAWPTKLGDVTDRMAQGIRTSANEIYVLNVVKEQANQITAYSEALQKEVELERDAVSLFLQGREIKQYRVLPSGKVVIMPYKCTPNARPQLMSEPVYEKHFPLTYAYLKANEITLRAREDRKFDGGAWYAYGRLQNIEIMQSPKILVPDIADRASFAWDSNGDYAFTSGYGITLTDKEKHSPLYILGLLNSGTLNFYLRRISTTLRGGFFRYFTQYLTQLPIRTIDFGDKKDVARHEKMVSLVTQMLETRPQLAAARTDRDTDLYTRKVASLDRQIDALVYELYGLTDDEIAIVESVANAAS